jgi:FXSXX-COOH protein
MLSVTDTIPGSVPDVRAVPVDRVPLAAALGRVLPSAPSVPVAAFGSAI